MSESVVRLYLNQNAAGEVPDSIRGPYLARIQDAFARGLHRTGGSTLKRLGGPYHGHAFRVRWKGWRAPVSWLPDGDGPSSLFVHQFANRDSIYLEDQFEIRLKRFHNHLRNNDAKEFTEFLIEAGYDDITTTHSVPYSAEDDEFAIELLSSEKQLELLRTMLPFPGVFASSSAAVILAHGAPGSGKTFAAMEAARIAAEGDSSEATSYSVLVLVPSKRLKLLYEHSLRGNRLDFDSLGRAAGGRPAGVTLCQAERFFAVFSGTQGSDDDRQRRLHSWWVKMLDRPRLRSWVKDPKHRAEVTSARFLRIVDAMLLEEHDHQEDRKDALDEHDKALHERLRDLRELLRLSGEKRGGPIAELRSELDFPFRSDMAHASLAALAPHSGTGHHRQISPKDPWPGRLLILVDEAQDLIPAEWATLIEWATTRLRTSTSRATRIVLLGDENQRISPTSFSWASVKEMCQARLSLPHQQVLSVDLPGSFRLNRTVACIAAEMFHSSVCRLPKVRHAARADPADLLEFGSVKVLVVPGARRHVLNALQQLDRVRVGDARLQIVIHDDAADEEVAAAPEWADILPARIVKGLEFPRLVVVEPFGGQGDLLSYDAAAVAYTAITRVIDDLLLVLTPEEWHLVARRWEGHGVTESPLGQGRSPMAELADALGGLLGEVDSESRFDVAMAGLRDALARMPVNGGKGEARGRIKKVSDHGSVVVRVGRALDLATEFGNALSQYGWLQVPLREAVADPDAGPETAIALLVLLGEYAAASQVAEAAGSAWAEIQGELEGLAKAEGSREEAALAIRRSMPIAPEVSSAELLHLAFVSHATIRAKEIPLDAPDGVDANRPQDGTDDGLQMMADKLEDVILRVPDPEEERNAGKFRRSLTDLRDRLRALAKQVDELEGRARRISTPMQQVEAK